MYIDEEYWKWRKRADNDYEEHTKRWYKNNLINTQKEKIKKLKQIKQCYIQNYINYKEEINFINYKKVIINKKCKKDLKFNLNSKIKTAINFSLRGNKLGGSWETILGYTLNDLIKRLYKTMPEGYCWQDYLNGKLHVDHIIPKSVFNYAKPEHTDFKRCWALSNLQLLPARENIIKSNHLLKPFQPALALLNE